MTEPKLPTLAFITVCKGRLHHLKESLPRMVAAAPDAVVVVDYGCPDGAGDWVASHFPSVRVMRVTDDPGFSAGRGRNLAAQLVKDVEWLGFVDADILVQDGFVPWLRANLKSGAYFRSDGRAVGTKGTCFVSRPAFEAVGGYDEVFRNWGGEDGDLYLRLIAAGEAERTYPSGFIAALAHDDAERFRYSDLDNKDEGMLTARLYMAAKQDLARLLPAPLAVSQRERLMAAVVDAVKREGRKERKGGPLFSIDLPEMARVTDAPQFKVVRRLSYEIQAKPSARRGVSEAQPACPPIPFVVGAGRSGTTMLRLMLDSHPDLAMPTETYFFKDMPDLCAAAEDPWRAFVERMAAERLWDGFGIGRDELRDAVRRIRPFDLRAAILAFYRLVAARQGKSRFGNKTPDYVMHMGGIMRLLPEARFIHILRDGRDVALSVLPLKWGPGTVEEAAQWWRGRIFAARAQEVPPGHYLEVHYEQLVRETEAVLRRICDFIELPFTPGMLTYYERSEGRMVSTSIHQRITAAPDPSRISRWRSEMSGADLRLFESIAGDALVAAGYELSGAC